MYIHVYHFRDGLEQHDTPPIIIKLVRYYIASLQAALSAALAESSYAELLRYFLKAYLFLYIHRKSLLFSRISARSTPNCTHFL
jgi:hypothetical protein